jgi:hypothetical protein
VRPVATTKAIPYFYSLVIGIMEKHAEENVESQQYVVYNEFHHRPDRFLKYMMRPAETTTKVLVVSYSFSSTSSLDSQIGKTLTINDILV